VSYLQLKSEDGIGLNTNSKMVYEPSGNTAVLNQVESETLAVTILMPCLNEAETLGICIRKALKAIRDLNLDGEVVVADNGSTDGSQDIAAREGARLVHVPVRGYGAALMAGIKSAKGEFILMADADDSYHLSHLPRFMAALCP
jgi:glycosyltransferase involved in cell wall biosynthesis